MRTTGAVGIPREVSFQIDGSGMAQPLGRSCGAKHSHAARVHLAQRALANAQQRYAAHHAQVAREQRRSGTPTIIPPATAPNLTSTGSQGALARPRSAPSTRAPNGTALVGQRVPQVLHVLSLDDESPPAPKPAARPPDSMGLMGHEVMARELDARHCSDDLDAADAADVAGPSCGGEGGAERPSSAAVLAAAVERRGTALENGDDAPPPAARPKSAPARRGMPVVGPAEEGCRHAIREAPAAARAEARAEAPAEARAEAPAEAPAEEEALAAHHEDAPLPPRRAIGYASPPTSPKKTQPTMATDTSPAAIIAEADEVLAGSAERVVASVGFMPPPEAPPQDELAPPAAAATDSIVSIADLLTPWPLGSVAIDLSSRRQAGGARAAGHHAGRGVYTTRPRVSAPGRPTAAFASGSSTIATPAYTAPPGPSQRAATATAAETKRMLMMRRAQHMHPPKSSIDVGASYAHAHTFCQGRRCQPGVRITSATAPQTKLKHRPPPGAPGAEGGVEVGGGDGDAPEEAPDAGPSGAAPPPPHRPAPGRSPGAQFIFERASRATRQWATHPSQAEHGADLYVGGPGRATGSAKGPTAGGTLRLPAHRNAPTIRARRPAWDRPGVGASPSMEMLGVGSGSIMSLVPTGEVAEAGPSPAGTATVDGMAIEPRRGSVTIPIANLAPPAPLAPPK